MTLAMQARRISRLLPLVGWTTVDHGLFALSNLVITLAVGRAAGAEGLGIFTVAFTTYLVVLGCSRSLASEPLLTSPTAARTTEAPSTTIVIAFTCACAVVVGLVGLLLGRVELLVLAAALPLLTVHDLLRYQAFRRGEPKVAVLLDGGWLLGSVLAWPIVTGSGSPTVALLCWAGGALLGVVLSAPLSRPRLSPLRAATGWWRRDARTVAMPLLLDSAIVAVSTQAIVFLLAALVGLADLGVLRAGQVYFAPVLLVVTALGLALVPRLAQRPALMARAVRLAVLASTATAVVCAAIIAAEPVLQQLLYAGAIDVPLLLLVPIALQAVLAATAAAFTAVAKARRRAGLIARSRLSSAIVGVAVTVLATTAYGVQGAAWAAAGQMALYTAEIAMRVLRDGHMAGRDGTSSDRRIDG